MTTGLALVISGALAAFLIVQFVFRRLAVKEDERASVARAQTRVYSREGAVYWLELSREHEERAEAFRRVGNWPFGGDQ